MRNELATFIQSRTKEKTPEKKFFNMRRLLRAKALWPGRARPGRPGWNRQNRCFFSSFYLNVFSRQARLAGRALPGRIKPFPWAAALLGRDPEKCSGVEFAYLARGALAICPQKRARLIFTVRRYDQTSAAHAG
jgi:hypothetical protein